MKTIDAIAAPDRPLSLSDPPPPAAPSPVDLVRSGDFAGICWTHRAAFDAQLARIGSEAWRTPQRQGWQRVKQNGARTVWRAELGGEPFYLKYYAWNRWSGVLRGLIRPQACEAEWNGGIYALRVGIPAVEPVAYASNILAGRRGMSVLVTRAIRDSQPLNEFWTRLRSDDDTRRLRHDVARLFDQLAEMIARAHQAGFEHMDMHAANLLVQTVGRRTYRTLFVDLHSARLAMPISDRAVVRNLAQLNQWFQRHATVGERLRFLRAYVRWRHEYEHAFVHARPLGLSFEQLVGALVEEAGIHAERLWSQRDRRVCRDGTYFARLRLPSGWRGLVVRRCKHPTDESIASRLTFDATWWRGQLSDPMRLFAADAATDVKNSHSGVVRRITLATPEGPLPAIVKRPLARNWRRAIRQRLATSRSMRAWRLGHALLNRDVATARPLAVLERRIGGLVLDSVLLTEAIPGAVDLDADLRREFERRTSRQWLDYRRQVADELALLLRRLDDRGFHHRDCKASNILVVREPVRKLLWIDMDGIRMGPSTTLDALVRLHVSLLDVPGLTRTDRLRFLRRYLARFGSNPLQWREVWRATEHAAALKQRALERRRAWKLRHYGRT